MREMQEVIKKCKELENNRSVISFLEDRIIQIRKERDLFFIYIVQNGEATERGRELSEEQLQEVLKELWG